MIRPVLSASILASAVVALSASEALACTADTECRGQRICVDGKCQNAAAEPSAAPASAPVAMAPAPAAVVPASYAPPPAAAPPAPVAPAATPVPAPGALIEKNEADDDVFKNASAVWSVSLMAALDNMSAPGGSQAMFEPHLHLELGGGIPTDLTKIYAVAYFDGATPTDFNSVFGSNVFGAGLGLGNRYRLTIGGGLSLLNDFTAGNTWGPFTGGNFMVHASAALSQHVGVHAHFSYSAWSINGAGISSVVAGIGLGYTM